MKSIKIIGGILLLIGGGLAWYWFSWKLTLILFLVLTGNNMEQGANLVDKVINLLNNFQNEMENILRRRN